MRGLSGVWRAARRPRVGLGVVAGAAIAVVVLLLAGSGSERPSAGAAPAEAVASRPADVVLTPDAVDPEAVRAARRAAGANGGGGQVVELAGAGAEADAPPELAASAGSAVSPGAPTDAEVRQELREGRAQLARFRRFLGTTAYLQTGPRARVLPDGTAVAPERAPEAVKRIIQAGNAISKLPYKWGGGHGAWSDNGYDCSGSVSFALAGAGLVESPLTSGGFMRWGAEGAGDWVTVYANGGHVFMVVAGLRFDTSGQGRAGTRWQAETRTTSGFAVRHVPGL